MANLQYIGARYVPKFYDNPDDNSNNWKSGVSYEAFTVVTYLDDSYTSKIPVPASVGNPADNSSYWIKTGNYNAALGHIETEIEDIQNALEKSKYIYVEDFGAAGDGATNDTLAFKSAIDLANTTGQTVSCRNLLYLLDCDVLEVKCNIDLKGAIIKPSANTGIIFNVLCDSIENKSISAGSITNKSVNDVALYGKGFALVSPLSMGLRDGSGDEYFYTQYIELNEHGDIINKNIPINIVAGTWTAVNACNLNEKPLTIKNMGVTFDHFISNSSIPILINSARPNVTIDGITIYGDFKLADTSAEIIQILRTCHNTIKNVSGSNPAAANKAAYIVALYESDDCIVENMNTYHRGTESWGSVLTLAGNNNLFVNCTTDRVDSHFIGTYTAKNCSLKRANYSGGYGVITIEDCAFVGNYSERVYNRTDYNLPFTGIINIKNCIDTNNTDQIRFFAFQYDRNPTEITSDFNTGYTNVIIDGCTIHNANECVARNNAKYAVNRNNVNVTVKNCELDVQLLGTSYRDSSTSPTYRPSPKFTFINNRIKVSGYSFMDGSQFGNTKFIGNIIEGILNMNGTSNEGLIVMGNTMSGLYTKTDSTICVDNIIFDDVAPSIETNVTHYVLKNNLISTANGSRTHEADWNV